MSEAAVLKVDNTLGRDDLLNVVLSSDELPSLPTVASQLISLTSQEETLLSDVAELISHDVALSSKILKVANSAFYNFPQQIGSIQQAVSMLGTNAVRSLVLSFSFLSITKDNGTNRFDFGEFWQKSLASGVAAKIIMDQVPGADTEEILVTGLLANLGELVLACTMPEEYDKVLARVEAGEEVSAVELEVLGLDHGFIGYEVAKHWSFPLSLALPILYHQSPQDYKGDDQKIDLSIKALYLADILIGIFHSDKPEEYHRRFGAEARRLLGLSPDQMDLILDDAHNQFDLAAAQFGLEMEEMRSIQEILQEANIRLSLLNLDYDQVNRELVKAKMELENLAAELQEKNEILKNLANVDGLTGAYNNRFFQSMLEKELKRTVRQNCHLALVLIDIDHFKRFNDEHGHLVGDFVLAEFSRVLSDNLREYDTLARYGGEEFVLILPDTSEENAVIVANKLRTAVESENFRDEGKSYKVTASFGVASVFPETQEVPDKTQLIKAADEALYEAKNRGRNQVVAYSPKKKWYKFKR
jgi:diguanylate cyclase (GGDEF)-like protein